jgi:hypothetical protein
MNRYKITIPDHVKPNDAQVTITLPQPGRERLKFNRAKRRDRGKTIEVNLSKEGAAHAAAIGLQMVQVVGPNEEAARNTLAAGMRESMTVRTAEASEEATSKTAKKKNVEPEKPAQTEPVA